MPTFDATTAECRVFTFKDGVLSAVAHDLELAVGAFRLEVRGAAGSAADEVSLDASFDARSLRVLHALRDGAATDQLSASDRAKIEKTLHGEVLHTVRHPDVRFEGKARPSGGGFAIEGTLTLCGQRRPLRASCQERAGRMVAEATVHQPDFGIRPYTAMLGTLKVRPDVRVRVSVPWPLPT